MINRPSLVPTFIQNYLKKTKSYSTLRFIIESSIIATLGKLLIAIFPGLIIVSLANSPLNELSAPSYMEITNPVSLFFLLCIISPIAETIIFQWLPITILQKITSNIEFIIGIDALIFAFAHLVYNFMHMLLVLPISVLLAWSFILNKDASLFKAFWVTVSIHALCNFISFISIVLF